MISQMLIFLLSVVSSIFCGRLGKEELDAAGLANNVKAIMGFSFGIGFCSATDTLLSQTFGRKNMKQIGVILQRSLLMLILICFPCWALFINTENILLLIKQDPKVARLTADYILICIPVLLGMFVYQLQASFLQNQEITVPQVFIGITANIINACLHYVFLFVLHLGVQGAALALNVAVISQIITTFFYIWIKDLHVETWEGWSWECLQNWHQVTKLAIPSILAVLFEWSIYDIGIILTGLISVTEQGVQSVILQIVLFLYMIPYSMGNAVCVRVGNALGAGNADQAKRSSTVALLSSGILIATDITFIGVSRTVIARLFTSDEEIISLSARTLLVYIIFHIFEAIACTSNGILKGMGKQKIGAVVYCIGYYVIGLPLAVILMFVAKFGVLGLWYGMTVGAFVPAFFLTIYILRTNWNTLKEEAEERTGLKQKPASLKCVYTHSSAHPTPHGGLKAGGAGLIKVLDSCGAPAVAELGAGSPELGAGSPERRRAESGGPMWIRGPPGSSERRARTCCGARVRCGGARLRKPAWRRPLERQCPIGGEEEREDPTVVRWGRQPPVRSA
ncbi:hypothetical protein NDU88_002662 [Pleurodeles waltl]|uniref:Multidrug and toxin extrusion protein n=1 Tax=Pleurodeles waltl TaxID=8319 RepID=A0AAV7UC65_PLEWA|nr:hypothetical protein NDU88_002662 [Pleurodeles waltl]